jgi:Uma2 family endonuclease
MFENTPSVFLAFGIKSYRFVQNFNEMIEYTYSDSETLSTAAEPRKTWTFEEYIAAEELSDEKHEFHNGKRITMAGGTPPHNQICGNVLTAINIALRSKGDRSTRVYPSDMNVYIPATDKSVYPDLSLVQGEPLMKSKQVILNPTLLVEVLSDSTEAYDRGAKFENYKSVSSFREYVLVSQKTPLVEVYYLENPSENIWKMSRSEGLEATVELRSIGCTLKMTDIYWLAFD